MRVRKYLYPVNHSWILLVDAEREDAVPPGRRGRLLGELDLDGPEPEAHLQADLDEVRRRLTAHGHCLNHPANGLLRQIGAP